MEVLSDDNEEGQKAVVRPVRKNRKQSSREGRDRTRQSTTTEFIEPERPVVSVVKENQQKVVPQEDQEATQKQERSSKMGRNPKSRSKKYEKFRSVRRERNN